MGDGFDDIDFWDLDLFERGDPHAAWRRLRAEAPVWWHDRPGGEASWSVTRYADCRAVLGDPLTFSSQRDGIALRSAEQLAAPPRGMGVHPMIHTDPPRHQPLRKVVSHRFTPRSIAELEEQLRSITKRCIDEALDKGDVDFVNDVAHRIPAEITFLLMGVPESEWDRLAELEHRTVTSSDPEFAHGKDPQQSAAEASTELITYFAGLVMQRIDDPGGDLIGELLRGRIDGERLDPRQVVAECGLLLAGGLDTTRAAASLGGMLQLLRNPDQLQLLRDDPSRLPTAIEEFVRFASPIVSETRTATKGTTIAGQAIGEGERVTLWTASANRDESVFVEPDRFDVARQPNRHLGFAYGEHFCLGAHLARLTLRVEFEELLARVAHFEQLGEPVRVRSNFVGGLKHLPLRLTAA
jgi:cytochrome P450